MLGEWLSPLPYPGRRSVGSDILITWTVRIRTRELSRTPLGKESLHSYRTHALHGLAPFPRTSNPNIRLALSSQLNYPLTLDSRRHAALLVTSSGPRGDERGPRCLHSSGCPGSKRAFTKLPSPCLVARAGRKHLPVAAPKSHTRRSVTKIPTFGPRKSVRSTGPVGGLMGALVANLICDVRRVAKCLP